MENLTAAGAGPAWQRGDSTSRASGAGPGPPRLLDEPGCFPLCPEQNPSPPHARPHPSARWCRRPSRPAASPCTSSARCLPSSGSWFCRPSSARTCCTSAAPGITATASGLQRGPGPAPASPRHPPRPGPPRASPLAPWPPPPCPASTAPPPAPRPPCPESAAGGGGVRARHGPTRPGTAPVQPQPRSRPHLRVEELRVGRDQLLLVRRLGHVLHLPQQPVLGQELQRHGRERRGREEKGRGRRRRGRSRALPAAPPAPRAAAGT